MIIDVDKCILGTLPENSVLIHQCNTKGWLGNGISKEIFEKWPNCFNEYHGHCRWFQDGHENELLGTFVGSKISPTFIICNAIAQYTVGKSRQQIDYDAWETICQKLETQTRRINKITGKKWTLHIPYRIGCSAGGKWDLMLEIFKKYFDNSPVELYIHSY